MAERTEQKSTDPLLKLCTELEQDALIEVFDRYGDAIYNYSLKLCHDPITADNIRGDVFGRLLDQFAAGKGPKKNLRSYLYQTAYHLVVDHARENQNAPRPIEAVMNTFDPENFIPTEEQAEERIFMGQLINAMESELTRDQRHVIVLRFMEGFSLKETAEIIGKKIGNVKVIQNRGIAKLRKAMGVGEEDYDSEVLPFAG